MFVHMQYSPSTQPCQGTLPQFVPHSGSTATPSGGPTCDHKPRLGDQASGRSDQTYKRMQFIKNGGNFFLAFTFPPTKLLVDRMMFKTTEESLSS